MAVDDSQRDDLLDRLGEEFATRLRRGEQPSVTDYTDRYPELADEIRELFPALVKVEQAKEICHDWDEAASRAPPLSQVGDYRIIREIGRGGMGVVYEAEQISLGRRVALKVLPRRSARDHTTLERFRREARASARLHHTNIVPVFEVGQDGDVRYYAMQFIQGQSLDLVISELRRLQGRSPPARSNSPSRAGEQESPGADAHTRGHATRIRLAQTMLSGRFDQGASVVADGPAAGVLVVSLPGSVDCEPVASAPQDTSAVMPGGAQLSTVDSGQRAFHHAVAQIGRQVASALAHAHAHGIVHRDIKPSNLLLDTDGVVWVSDFGLAKVDDDELTRTGDVLGTVRYLAPERFRGQGGAQSDLYSLGLTVYELLVLRPAFDAPDRLALSEQIKTVDPPRPRSIDPRVPRDLETIVLKAIEKDPKDRYHSADALAEDLRRFLADEPIRARQVSAAERAGRWCKRNPVVAGLLAAVFVLLAAVAGLTSAGYLREAALHAEADRQRQEADRQRIAAVGQRREADRQRASADAAQAQAEGEASRARAAEQEMRRQWYAASNNLIQPAWDTGQVGRLRALLAETEAYADRGFEWYYWQRLCHLDEHTFIGHRSEILSVSWSPDGARLATGSYDGTAKVWDAAGGPERLTLRGHLCLIYSVSWSPDGTRVATGSQDGTAKVWNATSGRVLLTLEGHSNSVTSVSWSPDGKRLATGSGDGTARVWDAFGGRVLLTLEGHRSAVRAVCWSPDGSRVATASYDGTAKVWDAASGRDRVTMRGHAGKVYSVSWSADATKLATGSEDGTAKVWDAVGGTERLNLGGHAGLVYEVSWSADGTRLATASSDGIAKMWDVVDGRERLILKGHTSSVRSVSWSPDGGRLATGSADGTAKVWNAGGGREQLILKGHTGPVGSVSWSPDGAHVATGSYDGTAKVWDAAGGPAQINLEGHAGPVGSVSWSPDGKRLATGGWDRVAKMWDLAGHREIGTLKGHTSPIRSVSWSPDGTRLATGSLDGTAKVWDTANGQELLTLKRHTGVVSSVSWSPDGKRLATGSYDGTAKAWDAAGGTVRLTLEGHTGLIYSVSWSPDGMRLATGSGDGSAKIWDANAGREVRTLKGNTSQVRSVSWSPDGTRLATGSLDGTAKVWDAAGGSELLTLKGHAGEVIVSWSPDGTRLATGSYDGTAKVWEAAGDAAVEEWARQNRAVQALLDSHDFRSPQAQGFVQTWLLLLPLPFDSGETSTEALDRPQLPDEANLHPRPGERVTIGGQPWLWQEYRSPQAVVDFNAVLGRVAERSVAYAVCYLESDQARGDVWLQVGSDDQARVNLNGRQIYRIRQPRTLWTLDTVGPVELKRGINVLLVKVVNETGQWEGCARLVDDAGRPIQGLRVELAP
jgi:WD40 repeat protein